MAEIGLTEPATGAALKAQAYLVNTSGPSNWLTGRHVTSSHISRVKARFHWLGKRKHIIANSHRRTTRERHSKDIKETRAFGTLLSSYIKLCLKATCTLSLSNM